MDYFIANELEAEFYCGAPVTRETAETEIRKMTAELGNVCIYTLGKAGSVVCDGKNSEFVPSRKIDAVESTGAGDSFIGGLCYALLQNMDIFEAAKFATCCSARTVCRIGGQPAMPFLDEAMELYKEA